MPEGIPYASSNVIAGAGLELNYVGEHAYAYSGMSTASSQTLLEFTSGNKLIVGTITCAGSIPNNGGGIANGDISAFTLSMNAVEVARMKTDTAQEDMPTYATYPILIPPYTLVKLTVNSSGTQGVTSAMIIGKVHK